MNFSQKDIDRFWKKVDRKSEDECWNWTACLNKGYGKFGLNGTVKGAHCCSLFLEKGEAPIDKPLTLHLCKKNRKCVNPNHLYYGDDADNGRDKVKDETQLRGETQLTSKLTEQQVREIRQKYIPWKYTQEKLAEEYGVGRTIISYIINNKNWTHVN
tara:strand:+ start:171 stop:641 length:471 start_codon:yes stop_codon:yes gene_type:complete